MNNLNQKEIDALFSRLEQETDRDSFDVSIADKLSALLGPDETCRLLTADQRDIVVDSVEMSLDCSGFVSESLMALYRFIIKARASLTA